MKYSDICEKCDHVVTAFRHTLNHQMVESLAQLYEFDFIQHKPCNLQKHLVLTKNQYNNFQKLQYFGLAEKSPEGWLITDLGRRFVNGKAVVYNAVATFGKQILSNDHIAWTTSKKKPKLVHIGGIKNYTWKPKEEYQLEKARGAQGVLI